MAATNASSDVFSTWKLCENILKFLPCDDLVRARRISVTLKKAVDQSPALRQSLFLQPCTETSVWTITTCPSDSGRDSSYGDKLLAGSNMARYVKEAISEGEIATEIPIPELYPELKLFRLHSVRHISWHLRDCARRNSFYNTIVVWFDSITDQIAGILRHSSLDKMLLGQPPVCQARVALKCLCTHPLTSSCPEEHFDRNGRIAIRNDSGLTFGQVRDCVQFARQQCATARFDYLLIGKRLLVTRREKQSVEAAGPLLWESNSFLAASLATIERLEIVV